MSHNMYYVNLGPEADAHRAAQPMSSGVRRPPAGTRDLGFAYSARAVDRWGRSFADLVTTLQELSALKIDLVSLSEPLNMTTPGGQVQAGILAPFARFEREIAKGLKISRGSVRSLLRPTAKPAG